MALGHGVFYLDIVSAGLLFQKLEGNSDQNLGAAQSGT